MLFASPAELMAELKSGRLIILVDDEERENEGDLVGAAEFITAEAVNFMATHGRGLICLALTQEKSERLGLRRMQSRGSARFDTAFLTSVEASRGVTTGISAMDRAHTIRTAASPSARDSDLVQPGHIFPLAAVDGGVLVRAGHTEAGCDLTRLAGLEPAAVICEVMNVDGSMARTADLLEFASKHGLKIGSIAALIEHRCYSESLVDLVGECSLETDLGSISARLYCNKTTNAEYLVLAVGDQTAGSGPAPFFRLPYPNPLDFIDRQPSVGMRSIREILSYIRREGSGILVFSEAMGASRSLSKYFSEARSLTVESEPAHQVLEDAASAQILRDMNILSMRCFPQHLKVEVYENLGIEVSSIDMRSSAFHSLVSKEEEKNILRVMRLLS